MTVLHPLQRRYFAEDLVRIRPADERRRYVASQRSGRIDPNPHQIEAVIFALNRVPEGGCILADEVGLGKTIEAGLVIAQLLAEGAERDLPSSCRWPGDSAGLARRDPPHGLELAVLADQAERDRQRAEDAESEIAWLEHDRSSSAGSTSSSAPRGRTGHGTRRRSCS